VVLKPKGWQGWLAALAVLLGAITVVALDLADNAVRRWWEEHAFTTGIVSGVLVLLLTLLIVNQVVRDGRSWTGPGPSPRRPPLS
jgi:hypothetical protein